MAKKVMVSAEMWDAIMNTVSALPYSQVAPVLNAVAAQLQSGEIQVIEVEDPKQEPTPETNGKNG